MLCLQGQKNHAKLHGKWLYVCWIKANKMPNQREPATSSHKSSACNPNWKILLIPLLLVPFPAIGASLVAIFYQCSTYECYFWLKIVLFDRGNPSSDIPVNSGATPVLTNIFTVQVYPTQMDEANSMVYKDRFSCNISSVCQSAKNTKQRRWQKDLHCVQLCSSSKLCNLVVWSFDTSTWNSISRILGWLFIWGIFRLSIRSRLALFSTFL